MICGINTRPPLPSWRVALTGRLLAKSSPGCLATLLLAPALPLKHVWQDDGEDRLPWNGDKKQALMETAEQTLPTEAFSRKQQVLHGAFFWLCAFYFVYCARPGDWISGFSHLLLAKITGIGAFLSLLSSLGKTKRKFSDLPKESHYL